MRLVLNLPMIGLWVKLLKVPKPQLYAGFLIFATVGAYGMRQSAIGEGSFMIFLQRPMSLSIFIVIVLVMVVPRLLKKHA